jgi:hypothetical protein
MTGINRLIEWLDDNKDVKISVEFIKLQAQMFALEESLNINYFESVTNIFNQKITQDGKCNESLRRSTM